MVSKSSKRHAWMAYSAICIMLIVWTGICYSTTTLYADSVVSSIGITRAQFMGSFTVTALVNMTISLVFYGQIESRIGIRKILLIFGIFATLAYICWACMTNIAMMYLGGVLYGIALGGLTTDSVATGVNHWFKKKMGTLISIGNMLMSVAGILFAVVVTALIFSVGWRAAFALTAAISAVATVVTVLLYKGDPEDLGDEPLYADEAQDGTESSKAEEYGIGYRAMFKTPQFWLLAIGYFFTGFCVYAVQGDIALFSVDYGYAELAGSVMSASLIASAVTMVPFGWLCDKAGSRWMLLITLVCVIVDLVILINGNISLPMLYVVGVLAGIGYNANLIPMGVSTKEAFGTVDYSKKCGTVVACSFLGVAFGPTCLNLFYGLTGTYTLGLTVFIAFSAIAIIGTFFGTRKAYR